MYKSNNLSVIKRVYLIVKKYRLIIALSLIFTILSVALSLYIPILAGKAIDAAVGNGNVNFVDAEEYMKYLSNEE